MPVDTLTPDTTQPEAKEPDRIATSTVKKYLEEGREYLETAANRADVAAINADTAAYYAKDARDSVNRFLQIAALGGVGLAIVTVGSVLLVLIVGFGSGHIISLW